MPADLTRKQFLAAVTTSLALSSAARGERGQDKCLLIVVAHPDDEYACAATTYRLVVELGWTADQVVITNGEGGYRYSTLAEKVYGKALTGEPAELTAVRREETIRAGRILGIRQHTFLNQRDLGFAFDPSTADASYWDHTKVLESLRTMLQRSAYDVVVTLLPTRETHAHHRAAAQLTLEAVAEVHSDETPLVLGVEAGSAADAPPRWENAGPALEFDRTASFGYDAALNYQIVVNWLIAEYKSQGLFQKDCGKHDREEFWILRAPGAKAHAALRDLQTHLPQPVKPAR